MDTYSKSIDYLFQRYFNYLNLSWLSSLQRGDCWHFLADKLLFYDVILWYMFDHVFNHNFVNKGYRQKNILAKKLT